MRGIAIATIMVCVLGACSLSDKDKDRVVEIHEQVIEPCIGLEGEELRDCLVDRAKELTEEIVDKADN